MTPLETFFEFWNMEHILIKYYIIIYFERFFFVFFVETGAVRNRWSEIISTSTTRVIQQLHPLFKSILGTSHLKTEDFLMSHRKRHVKVMILNESVFVLREGP